MKILQTGDLHLGKLFYEFSLLTDQRCMLDSLVSELQTEKERGKPYDVLLIAGDVYDRAVPSAEAVALFSWFLAELKKTDGELAVLIIPGNHDSALRLSFASDVLSALNIHIITDPAQSIQPITVNGVAFYLMPFLTSGAIQHTAEASPEALEGEADIATAEAHPEALEGKADTDSADSDGSTGAPNAPPRQEQTARLLSQNEMAFEVIRRINAARDATKPAVLCAHLFTAGSVSSDSERILWGNAEQVDSHLFDSFTYTALGHLHRYQKAGKNAYYAGSPLVYSFDECGAEKCFLRVEFDQTAASSITVTKCAVTPLRSAHRLSGSFEDFYNGSDFDSYADSYLEIQSTDETVTENPLLLLKQKFPYLLSFRQEKAMANHGSATLGARRESVDQTNGDIQSQFAVFLQELNGEDEPNGDKKDIYIEEISLFSTLYARSKERVTEG